jgi:hypothetical protein
MDAWKRFPGTDIHEAVQGMIDKVNEPFERQLNVHVELVHLQTDELADPYNVKPGDNLGLLNQFKGFWVRERKTIERDATILLTRRSVRVAGLAFPSTICYPAAPYGICFGLNHYVVAHELGHIVGMGHDPSGHWSDPKYIMTKSVTRNMKNEFSDRSVQHFLRRMEDPRTQCILQDNVPPPPEKHFIRGDCDGDGVVKLGDALLLLDAASGKLPGIKCQDAFDVDDNGSINIRDGIQLLRFLYGGGEAPKAPHPEPGPDPTQDFLKCA